MRDLVLNRSGFPWPRQTVVWHGTAFVPEILREGFKTRSAGAPQMAGGRFRNSTSFTLVEARAAAVALGLDVMARVASGRASLVWLLDRLTADLGSLDDSDVGPLVCGSNFQCLTLEDPGRATALLRPVLREVDRGWTFVHLNHDDARTVLPSGWRRLGERAALAPPGVAPTPNVPGWCSCDERERRWYHMGRLPAVLELYRRCLSWGEGRRRCFNPVFLNTRVDVLARRPAGTCGVVACTLDVDGVCVDAGGAIALGMWPAGRPVDYAVRQVMDSVYQDCLQELDGLGAGHGRVRWPAHLVPPWFVRQQGTRRRDSTVVYSDGEQEVMVFDPGRIRIVGVRSVRALRGRHGVGGRVTFPWYWADDVDVRLYRVGESLSS